MADRSFLFWPFLDPRHLELHDRVETWVAENIGTLNGAASAANASARRHLAEAMGEAGFFATTSGGRDGLVHAPMDRRSLCICREVLARHAHVADLIFAVQGLGTAPIGLFGTERQKARWLASAAQGKSIATFALSEAEDDAVSALTTRARPDGDHWRLDGVKTWISNAAIADLYVVFAHTGEASPAKGLSAFVVTADTPGLSIKKTIDNLIAQQMVGTIVLDDVRVPSANMLGAPGDGFRIARATLDMFRSSTGAAALGLARSALGEAARLARARKPSGQSLSDFRLTHAKLAEMALAVDAAALLIYRAAWTKDVRGAPIGREFSMAKRFAIEKTQIVIDGAVEIFGGLSTTHGRLAERLYREMRALRIHERASEIQESSIATPLLTELEAESCETSAFADLSAVNAGPALPHW